jgi:hypothetical protein
MNRAMLKNRKDLGSQGGCNEEGQANYASQPRAKERLSYRISP